MRPSELGVESCKCEGEGESRSSYRSPQKLLSNCVSLNKGCICCLEFRVRVAALMIKSFGTPRTWRTLYRFLSQVSNSDLA